MYTVCESLVFTELEVLYLFVNLLSFVFIQEKGIRCGRVVSVVDVKTGVPGSIPSRGTTVMLECPWARHTI